MYTLEKIKSLLFDATSQKNITALAETIYHIFQKPCLIMDVNGYILAQYPEHNIGNLLFDKSLIEKRIPYSFYDSLVEDSIFEHTEQHKRATYLNWGIHKDSPHFYAPSYIHEIHVAGLTLICEQNFLPSKEDYDSLDLCAKAVAMLCEKPISQINSKKTFILSQLFTNTDLADNTKNLIHRYFHIDPSKKMCVIVSRTKNPSIHEKSKLSNLGYYFENNNSNLITWTNNNELILWLYNIHTSDLKHSSIEKITKHLHKLDFEIGISQLYSILGNTIHHKEQAYLALNIGKILDSSLHIFAFEHYSVHCIANQLLNLPNKQSYIHPAYLMLEEMDKESNYSNLDTLITYITSSFEVTKAANRLNIHKSTLVYRLQKIRDLCEIDLSDSNVCTQILLNKYMREIETQNNHNVSQLDPNQRF